VTGARQWRLFLAVAGTVGIVGSGVGQPQNRTPRPSPVELAERVGIDQHLGSALPLETTFLGQTGRELHLQDLFGQRPVLLAFVYYECPMLCTEILNGVVRGLAPLDLEAGTDYDLVAISIDPGETPELARKKCESYRSRAGHRADRPDADRGWHFLVGEEAAIEAVTRAAGFRFVEDEATGEFAHASGIMILTPRGVLSRYLLGVDYAPRDLKLAVLEASDGRVGSLADALLMLCFHYDPATGRYGLAIQRVLRAAGLLTVAVVGGSILWMRRRERRAARLRPSLDEGGA
jgi:protein SCO1/2